MRAKLLFFMIFVSVSIFAQSDSLKPGWNPKAVVGINLNQVAFSNWAQGGENSLAFTLFGTGDFDYLSGNWLLVNNLKIAYGRTKLGDDDFRTNDNELFLENVLSYNIAWAVDPYFSNTLRTVVAKGYEYTDTSAIETAAFFDPAYITQSIGFTYNKSENFTTRLGLAVQEIITNRFTGYSDDPDTPNEIEKLKVETGIESVTETSFEIDTNMLFGSKLRLFTRFDDIDVWDVRWDNIITAKVSEYINVNLNVLVVYEKSQSLKTQLKEALQLGFSYRLF